MQSPLYQRVPYALLRIAACFVIMQHGAQKFLGALGGFGPQGGRAPLFSLMGLAGIVEFLIAGLVLVGLFTRVAAFIVSGEMASAYFIAHAPHGFWPVHNHGESPVLLCFIFLVFAAFGAGSFSLDALLFGGRRGGGEDALRAT